jgi:hypothetical protein
VSAVEEETETTAFDDAKVELSSTRSSKDLSYGPTFKEDETVTHESIYLTETFNESKISESDSKRNSLLSKFYRRASNTTTLVDEEQGKNEKDTVVREDVYVSKTRSLLYRQFFGGAKYVVVTWIFAVAMISCFVYEIVKNQQLSGQAIQTNPFNPMIGPNYAVKYL